MRDLPSSHHRLFALFYDFFSIEFYILIVSFPASKMSRILQLPDGLSRSQRNIHLYDDGGVYLGGIQDPFNRCLEELMAKNQVQATFKTAVSQQEISMTLALISLSSCLCMPAGRFLA